MISKIWQHKITGDLYAVAVDSYGMVVGGLGPLGSDDIKHVLAGNWESDGRDTRTVRDHANNFKDITVILENERDRRLLRAAGA
jgi:hypothetical protein